MFFLSTTDVRRRGNYMFIIIFKDYKELLLYKIINIEMDKMFLMKNRNAQSRLADK